MKRANSLKQQSINFRQKAIFFVFGFLVSLSYIFLHKSILENATESRSSDPFPDVSPDTISTNLFQRMLEDSSRKKVIIYNRLGKSGSTTMSAVLAKQCEKQNCSVHNVGVEHRSFWEMTESATSKLVNYISKRIIENKQRKSVFIHHGAWIDWEKHGKRYRINNPPLYINIVREPVSRMRSLFFYRQSYWGYEKGIEHFREMLGLDSVPENGMLIDPVDCVDHESCFEILYNGSFSGILNFLPTKANEDVWKKDELREERIRTAVEVIKLKYYLVIPLEAIQHGLALLECMLPSFFEGALDTWNHQEKRKYDPYQHDHIPKLTQEGHDKLQNLAESSGEMAVYRATVQKFCELLMYIDQNNLCNRSAQSPLREVPDICSK